MIRRDEESSPTIPYADGPLQVIPKIWLGSEDNARDWKGLVDRGITSILNVAKEVTLPFDASLPSVASASSVDPNYYPPDHSGRPGMHYLKLSWSYGEQNLVNDGFKHAMTFIDAALEQGDDVLIHGESGILRSATLVIALVMRAAAEHASNVPTEVWSLKGMQGAYSYVKEKSKWISPNMSLIYQLLEYEKKLKIDFASPNSPHRSSSSPADEEEGWGRQGWLLDEMPSDEGQNQENNIMMQAQALGPKAMEDHLPDPLTVMFQKATICHVENSEFNNSSRDMFKPVLESSDVIDFFLNFVQPFLVEVRKNDQSRSTVGNATSADGSDPLSQAVPIDHGDPVNVINLVPPEPSSLPVASVPDRYTRAMLKCLAGYPLYEPQPFSELSTEYLRQGVNVGDVGFVTEDGAFDFLFNVCLSKNSLINPSNLPDGFSLENAQPPATRETRVHSRKTSLFQSPIAKMNSGEYRCKGSTGAVLELPEGAINDEAMDIFPFEKLAARHGVQWYEYTLTRDRKISNGSLYLITSFTKCAQWGIAIFDRQWAPGHGLRFAKKRSHPFGKSTAKYHWKGSHAFITKVSDPNQEETPNQCVFLQGYKIMIRQDIFKNMAKSDEVVLHANFNSYPVHPSDLINAALLRQNPGAKVALTHDNVWCDLLRDNFPKLDHAALINIARSFTNIVDEYDCVSLKNNVFEESHRSLQVVTTPVLEREDEHVTIMTKDKDINSMTKDKYEDATVLEKDEDNVLLKHITQHDFLSDPSLYKAHICHVLNIQFVEVIDLTGHINRHTFIAAGGAGEVWKALWIGLDRNPLISNPEVLPKVTVKLVRLPPLRDEVEKDKRYKRMKRELELWSKLNHPHILPLIGIARIEGDANLPAFISPWMENGNVMEFLKQNPSFPASRFIKDIIKGLQYLHTFNPVIVHGDIKGANVLINHRKEACLCDFSLSRFVVDNTLWRTTATRATGTLRWMAPELIENDIIVPTIPTDIYAFGMTCYEIISRKTPFATSTNEGAVISKVIKGQRPERIESCYSNEIWSIITRCWAQEPENRPSTEETLLLVMQHDTP